MFFTELWTKIKLGIPAAVVVALLMWAFLSALKKGFLSKGGYTLDPMAEHAVKAKLTGLYNNRERTFGNAREARNLFDDVKGNLAARLAEDGGAHTPEERKTIMMEDVI